MRVVHPSAHRREDPRRHLAKGIPPEQPDAHQPTAPEPHLFQDSPSIPSTPARPHGFTAPPVNRPRIAWTHPLGLLGKRHEPKDSGEKSPHPSQEIVKKGRIRARRLSGP